jgi:hypothetical protein
VLAVAAALPVIALAHGSFGAHARQPEFDTTSLRLVGSGGYGSERRHTEIRVTVCLRKRYGGRLYTVRCQTDSDTDRRVKAEVSVPGCVDGVWRTTASGQALGKNGEWTHDSFDVSPPYRC